MQPTQQTSGGLGGMAYGQGLGGRSGAGSTVPGSMASLMNSNASGAGAGMAGGMNLGMAALQPQTSTMALQQPQQQQLGGQQKPGLDKYQSLL